MKKETSLTTWLLVVLNVVICGLLVTAYFLYFPSIKRDVEAAENQLSFEQRRLIALEEQLEFLQAENVEEDIPFKSFQRQVPVEPLVDQFIFDIEKAEVFSESFISNYSFSVGTVNYEKEVNQAHQNDQSDGESTESDQEQPTSETVTHEIGKVTVTLAIESPSYEHLVEFLSRIERVDRVTKVDNIAFNGPSELQAEISADEDKEEEQILSYTVTISTFFLPELGQYLDTEPMIPYPKPSDKENPLLIN